jgi:hypothetical protein
MRTLALIVAAALVAGPALGQAPAAAPKTSHAPYTLETPILTLMEDPRTLKFLDDHLPGLSERMRDPEVAQLFGDSSLADMSKDADHGRMLTPEVMAKLAGLLAEAQAEPAADAPPT